MILKLDERKKIFLQLVDITDEGFLALMDDNGETREDLKLPANELGEEIRKKFAEDTQVNVSQCPWI